MKHIGWVAALLALACGKNKAPESPVEVAGLLDADHTALFVAVELERAHEHVTPVLDMVRSQLALVPKKGQGDDAMVQAIEAMATPEGRRAKLGFDPAVQGEWTKAGLQPDAAASLVVDDRVKKGEVPLPVVLVRASDRGRLVAWLAGRLGEGATTGKEGACEVVRKDPVVVVAAQVGAYVALVPSEDPAAACTSAQALAAAPARPVSATPAFREAFKAARRGSGLTAFVALPALRGLVPMKGADAEVHAHFVRLLTGAGLRVDAHGSRLAVALTPDGHRALAQIMPAGTDPAFRRLVPKDGWGAARVSIDLEHALDGVAALAPPSSGAPGAQAAALRDHFSAKLDVPWQDVTAALDGHFLGALDLSTLAMGIGGGLGAASWVGAAGVRDGGKADALLGALFARAGKATGATPAQVKVGGHAGWSLDAGRVSVVVVRKDKLLVGAQSASALELALGRKREDTLATVDASHALEDERSWAYHLDTRPLLAMAKLAVAQQPELASSPFFKDLSGPIEWSLRLHEGRVEIASEAGQDAHLVSTAAVGGVLAAIAIPAFTRYVKRSRAAAAARTVKGTAGGPDAREP